MKLASIDVGTNSIHMVVVEANGRRGFDVIDREKTMVKLGAGLFTSRRLSDRAVNAALEVLRRYCKLGESLGVDEILAVATSATREADNGEQFLDAIFRETGLSPRVISGVEEAKLIFLAVRHAIDLGDQRILGLDIGGGSVEAVVGDFRDIYLTESMRLGVQRLLDRQKNTEPLTSRQLAELQGYIRGAAGDVLERARDLGIERVVGTSGTIRTLAEAAHLAAGGAAWRSLNAQVARRKDIWELTKRLCDMDAQKRSKVDRIGDQRADSIHLGAVLLSELLNLAGVDEITLCDEALREGVILDYLDRHGPAAAVHKASFDTRRRSVLELARRYEREDPREEHVAKLALELFDRTVRLHDLGERERELLEYAALLFAVGQYINFKNRHKHSQYIVRHSSLRGFTDEEIELLGLLVRYHRRAAPSKKHARLKHLPEGRRRVVQTLSSILRLAVALDRGASQVVKHVGSSLTDQVLKLELAGAGDLELELWAARRKCQPLADALGVEVRIERAEPIALTG